MNLGRRGKRPAFLAAAINIFGDLLGQLFVNPAIGLGFQVYFRRWKPGRDARRRLSVTGKRPARSVTLSTSLPCASVISKAWINFKLGRAWAFR